MYLAFAAMDMLLEIEEEFPHVVKDVPSSYDEDNILSGEGDVSQ